MPDMLIPGTKKTTDIMFYACITNQRRLPFINKVQQLKQKYPELVWDTMFTPNGHWTPEKYKIAINKAKVGLHYFGNSSDSWRIWELASSNTAIIMPKLKLLSIQGEQPFTEYAVIKDDFSDIEEKILETLKDNKYTTLANEARISYDKYHSREKCFQYYINCYKKHIDFLR
jgi:hypothetical protein